MDNRTSTEWAYLAGILDSDGCIGASYPRERGGNSQVTLLVGQIDPGIPEWLGAKFGGSVKVYVRGPNNFNPGATMYRWRVSAKGQVESILVGAMPYLIYKQPQAKLALLLCRYPLPSKDAQVAIVTRLRVCKHERR